MRISDWSSDVCSSDLVEADAERVGRLARRHQQVGDLFGFGAELGGEAELRMVGRDAQAYQQVQVLGARGRADDLLELVHRVEREGPHAVFPIGFGNRFLGLHRMHEARSEEHTSELQSLMRTSNADFGLKKKNTKLKNNHKQHTNQTHK